MVRAITPRDPGVPSVPGSFFVRYPDKGARMRELWADKVPLKRMASELGCGTSTIVRAIREFGLPLRVQPEHSSAHVVAVPRVHGPTIQLFDAPPPSGVPVGLRQKPERAPGTCQWPMTADRPWRLCDAPCGSDVYCGEHKKLAKGVAYAEER